MKRVSLLGVLGVLSYLVLVPAAGSLAATAGTHAAAPVVYPGTAGHAVRLALPVHGFKGIPKLKIKSRLTVKGPGSVIPFRSPGGSYPAKRGSSTHAAKINASGPAAAASAMGATGTSLVRSFNGISDGDQAAANPSIGEVTPPDQGLCVGRLPAIAGKTTLVFEMVNLALRVTDSHGNAVSPDIPLADWFGDPYAEGDPRCLYDASTQSFYFTEIGFPGGPATDLNNTTVDVTVLNKHGDLASYQFDTSLGGPSAGDCFGDQPKTGFDNNVLVVSTDEYCGPLENNYEGAIVLAISKPQLNALALNVNDDVFGPVSLGGIPVTGLDPAIGTGTGTGYLVNSFPFDANGNNNAISNSLGLWSLEHDSAVTTGSGTPDLDGKLITSEYYAFPVPAASTGDGSVTAGITSEAFLNPDDSRLSAPVEVTHSGGHVQLWTALDAGVAVTGDPTARDGAAWFRIDTGKQAVVDQGYVAAKGAYLLYPAVMAPPSGPAAMVFTITSTSINPSSAFTTLGSKKIKVVAAGAGPHVSFSDFYFGTPRWGDYSFVAADPGGEGIWLATEYIPQVQDPVDNWGTSVFEVAH